RRAPPGRILRRDVADRRCAALGGRGLPRALPAVRGQPPRPRGPAVRRSRPGVRATVELGPYAIATTAGHQRQDDLPRHHLDVLMPKAAFLLALALALGAAAVPVQAEPLPPGSLGALFGAGGGSSPHPPAQGRGPFE